MKIIGRTEGKLLIEASCDEVANLMGYYSTAEKVHERGDYVSTLMVPGRDFKISEMYQQLYKMSHLKKELDDAAAKLRVCADTLQLTSPIVEAVTNPENPQEVGSY